MKNKLILVKRAAFLLLLSTINYQPSTHAQGTAFTYQGRLNDGANLASGSFDLKFSLFTASSGGSVTAGPVTNSATTVSNGWFTTAIDFGPGIFNGTTYWLEIAVRTNGGGTFTTLTPRQQLTPTPYAIFAEGASAAGLSGTIPAASIGGTYGNPVNFNNGADSFNGTFYGQFFGSSFVGGNFVGSFIGSGVGLADVWHTTGNLNTSPTNNNFLGTLDNQPLEVRVNNTRILRLEPGGSGNIIGGHSANQILPGSTGSFIAGGGYAGGPNVIRDNSSGTFIGAGSGNQAGPASFNSVIGGGSFNVMGTNTYLSVIGGGDHNIIGTAWAVIAGGYYNTNNGLVGFIGAGDYNIIGSGGYYAFLGGGFYNFANGYASFIGAGGANSIDSDYSFIGGGYQNVILTNDSYSVIGGGWLNNIRNDADQSVIAGGNANSIQFAARESFVGGGFNNVIESNAVISTIVGGANNSVGIGSYSSSIGGGQNNLIQSNADHSVIGGGGFNTIGTNANGAAIDSGYFNTIGTSADRATIAGGNGNVIQNNSTGSTIGGGIGNTVGASSGLSTIAGGDFNVVQNNSTGSTIGGGLVNTNGGYGATVPGGVYNLASGAYSFAAGYRAKATNDGSFVWADSQDLDFGSTTANQFNVRANGGVRLVTAGAGITLDGQPLLGSANFIQNQTAAPQSASFRINGSMSASTFAVAGGTASGTVAVNGLTVTNNLRVPGAGIGTSTPVFVHRATAANIETGATHRTTINNPLCDGDPNAILIITHNFGPSGIVDINPSSVYYNSALSKWQIYHDNFVAMTTNNTYNVLIVKP